MSRKALIAGNWKMFKTGSQAVATAKKLAQLVENMDDRDIMIAPTLLSLPLVSQNLEGTPVKTGAQNLFHEKEGAFTGEVSAEMIKAAGADYVIIGHSERRQYFHETDNGISKKIKAAFDARLTPILCIGETHEEKKEEKTFYVLDKQIRNGLKGFRSADELSGLVIAYEPVWAIGTGNVATPEDVETTHQYVRSLIMEIFGKDLANATRILYGGSVKPDNVSVLMSMQNIDGALVGGASLDADTFIKIIKFD
ncbi:triosephosphate isomerase [Desulfocicer vacuolatum DSM 3385]|uniref:Triosephosphate isomerase n=1 Tax=Desulfocicer vacuolatum DSM 3385 TaxID=1121400 RepID=A0A1W2CET3_9BACT|nr:triose-phosphate isomerase [Desulfocicer vacuolatum]SMC83661.1 triosephosphate isomerase [Desulfocicer vacuolatum DSM 3385]